MVNINELSKSLNILYDYGETKNNIDLRYLVDQNFIKVVEDRVVITKKWVKYSGKVNRIDFLCSLFCYYPLFLNKLLQIVYKEACNIGQKGDSKPLYEFIDSISNFSEVLLRITNEVIEETIEIKAFYQVVFNGYPQYSAILNKLRLMQLAEEIEDVNLTYVGNSPNEIWTTGRRVTSSVHLDKLSEKCRYSFVPYNYSDFSVEEPVKDVLSYPWKLFLITLSMVALEYRTAGFEGLSIRPTDYTNYYTIQPLDFYVYNVKGREIMVGRLNNFVYEFCGRNDIYLFPDTTPEVDKVVFELMDENKMSFRNGEYVLDDRFKDLIYSKDIVIKNRGRKFRNMLRDYIEKLRTTL